MGKSIAKKIASLNKLPHPKGRKAAQLSKNTIRTLGRAKTKLRHQMKVNILGEKILWFQQNLEPVDRYTPQLTLDLIDRYLGRFDEELQQIELKHSTGMRKIRQHASREDIIKMTIKNEENEFLTNGIEMPDVLSPKQLDLLRNWSGELRYLQNFTLVRYTKGKLQSMKCSVQDSEESKTVEETDKKKTVGSTKNEEVQKQEEDEMKMNVDS